MRQDSGPRCAGLTIRLALAEARLALPTLTVAVVYLATVVGMLVDARRMQARLAAR